MIYLQLFKWRCSIALVVWQRLYNLFRRSRAPSPKTSRNVLDPEAQTSSILISIVLVVVPGFPGTWKRWLKWFFGVQCILVMRGINPWSRWRPGLPSCNQTWRAGKWTMEISEQIPNKTSIQFGDFPASHVWLPESTCFICLLSGVSYRSSWDRRFPRNGCRSAKIFSVT